MPPRVWTVFAAFVLIGIAIQAAVMSTGLICAWWQTGETQILTLFNRAAAFEQTHAGFVICRLPAHLVLLAGTLLLAWRSPQRLCDRLGMTRCRWSVGQWIVTTGAALVPLLASLCFAAGFVPVLEPIPFTQDIHWGPASAYLFYMTIAPPFVEELFFRGYMQRRLMQRWPAVPSLLITAVLFTIAHGITPAILVTVFPVALWLGMLAWKTGSIWPGCVCHAWLNFLWCGWPVLNQLAETSPVLSIPFGAYVIVLAGLCFLLTLSWLHETRSAVVTE